MTQPSVPPRGRTWTFPASSGQERVWLAQQLDPSSPVFTVPAGTVLAARDAGEVLDALRAVVARHDALRTELRLQDGELVQVVHSEVPVEAEVVDVRDGGADLSAVVVPTDSAPLWRARVVRLAEGRWRLDLAVHHAVFDAASLTVLHRELAEVAAARRAGRPPRLPELTIQYPDFAVWERGGRTGPAVRAHLAYWREQLAGLPGVHAVPTDRPRRAELRYAGGEARFAVPPPLRTGVDALAARLSCTPFTVLLAAWAALLGRLSGRDEVVVGTTTWGRDQPQLAPLIGMFVNPVVLRVPLDGDPDVAALVRRVRDVVLDATEHAGVPFQAVVEQVLPQRLPGVQPLYQLGVNHVPDSGVEPTVATTAPDDLGLDLARDEGRLRYRSDLFDRESAEAVVRRYLGLLAALVADPARPVADLPLMDAAERARVLGGWGAGPRPEPPVAGEPGTLHGLVLRRLADDPAALAVEGAGTRLTRGELAARVAGTAHHLRERGVGRGDVVAVCGDPSPAVVAALLGVLAAGGTYLPLDPGHPPERLASLAADAGAALVLAAPGAPALGPAAPPVLPLDGEPWWAGRPAAPPADDTDPVDPAYVVFTSGSTGRPKGVVVEHRAVLAYLRWACRAYPGLAGQALLHSSIAFDLSVTALFGPLLAGGSVRCAPLTEDAADDAPPTFLKATPSHLDLLGVLPATLSPTVDLVLGGEALTAEALHAWRAEHPGVAVTNEYGPTEAAVGCVAARIAPGEDLPPGPVRIGRPVAGMRAVALDRHGGPVPPGAVGELVVAGPQLARGYHDDPGLTAARFTAFPAAGVERGYRTGDLVRLRRDGELVFLGRADDQINLHGHRVEPGEIEAALRTRPGVREAAVVLRDDLPGPPRLVAYATGEGAADEAGLWAALRRGLPGHLVPSALVVLDALPLTAHGKLDRTALPPPAEPGDAPGDRPPDTAAEELVAEVVAPLLGRDAVGADADFFALGGNSLLAVRVAAGVRDAVGVDLPVRAVFTFPTVAALAQEVERLLIEEIDRLDDDEVHAVLTEGGTR